MQSNKICEYKVRAALLNVIIYERYSFQSVSCATWAFSSPDRTRPLLTLVFLLPWMTTGRESWAVFLTRTRPVPNLSSTSSADYRSKASLWKWAGRYDDRYLKICTFYSGGSKRNKSKNPHRQPRSGSGRSGICDLKSCWGFAAEREHLATWRSSFIKIRFPHSG